MSQNYETPKECWGLGNACSKAARAGGTGSGRASADKPETQLVLLHSAGTAAAIVEEVPSTGLSLRQASMPGSLHGPGARPTAEIKKSGLIARTSRRTT